MNRINSTLVNMLPNRYISTIKGFNILKENLVTQCKHVVNMTGLLCKIHMGFETNNSTTKGTTTITKYAKV